MCVCVCVLVAGLSRAESLVKKRVQRSQAAPPVCGGLLHVAPLRNQWGGTAGGERGGSRLDGREGPFGEG